VHEGQNEGENAWDLERAGPSDGEAKDGGTDAEFSG